MGQPRRLGQPVATDTAEYPVNGTLKVNPVADRNIQRLDSGPGPEGGPDNLIPVHKLGVATRLGARHQVTAAQPGLSATDGRFIQE